MSRRAISIESWLTSAHAPAEMYRVMLLSILNLLVGVEQVDV